MKMFLIILNVAIILIFCRIIYKLKVSMTSLFLFTFTIFYIVGFLVIGFNPDGSIWNYLNPDMRRVFAFPLGTGEPQIYFITMVNLSLLLGLGCGLIYWPKTTLITNSFGPIIEKHKNLLEPLAWYFFTISLCYMIIRFYFVPDLPLYQLIIHGGCTKIFSDAWLSNKNTSWIFLPSVYMQFLQYFQPISCLLFYLLFELNKTKRTFIIFIFSTIVNFFSLILILKRAPFIIFGISMILMPFIYKVKIKFDKPVALLCGSIFILFGVFGMTKLQNMNHHNIYLHSNVTVQPEKILSHTKPPLDFDFSEKSFKSSKVPLDFNKDMNKIKAEYNEKHYGPVSPLSDGIIPTAVCRILTEEMIASFIIVGNPELMTYIKNSNPIHTYMQKVFGYKTKNIYESIMSILAGVYCPGSTTISIFLELYIFLGYYSILMYILIGFLLVRADIFIVKKLDRSFAPIIVCLMIVIAQAPLKGLMTTLFTVGGMSCLCLFFIFYLYFVKGFYKFLPHKFIAFNKRKKLNNNV